MGHSRTVEPNTPAATLLAEIGKEIMTHAATVCHETGMQMTNVPSMLSGSACLMTLHLAKIISDNNDDADEDLYGMINAAMDTYFGMLKLNYPSIDWSRVDFKDLWGHQ
jgi:hypothetical protein